MVYFKILKAKEVLTEWKQSQAGKREALLSKDQFPILLKTVLEDVKPNVEYNLKTGFKKCGIYPVKKAEILAPWYRKTNQ